MSLASSVEMLGFGMVIPILPFYIEQFHAGGSAFGLLVATAALTAEQRGHTYALDFS